MNEREHIQRELADTPLLRSMQGKSLYQAPEGYFAGLPGRLSSQIEEVKLMEEAPHLHAVGRELSHPLPPEGYFEQLPGRIMNAVRDPLDIRKSVRPLWQHPRVWMAVAAVSLLLMGGLWLLTDTGLIRATDEPMVAEVALTDEELITMLELQGAGIYDIAQAMDLSQLNEEQTGSFSEDELSYILDRVNISGYEAGYQLLQ